MNILFKILHRFFPLYLLSAPAFAGVEVRFTPVELDAGYTLLRPELNAIEIDGRVGRFNPAPSLRYFGLDDMRFVIDFNTWINLIDLEFSHLRAMTPTVRFVEGAIELTIPLQDQERVIRSKLGGISIRDVSLVGVLQWRTLSNGAQTLELTRARFNGDMRGYGVLRPDFILQKARRFLVKTLSDQVQSILKKPGMQEQIQNGLMQWARFTTGTPNPVIERGSIGVDTGGIHFRLE
ncbi:hypothetical protein EB061_10620 [bacterium]|nr:hypothetical protein [bacterium]